MFDMDIRIRTWLGAAKAVISHCIQISVIYTLLSQSQRYSFCSFSVFQSKLEMHTMKTEFE